MTPITRREFFRMWRSHPRPWQRGGYRTPRPERVTLVHEACLAWGGQDCVLCHTKCPRSGSALLLQDGKPVLVPEACDNCGECVTVCRTVNDRSALRFTHSGGA